MCQEANSQVDLYHVHKAAILANGRPEASTTLTPYCMVLRRIVCYSLTWLFCLLCLSVNTAEDVWIYRFMGPDTSEKLKPVR